MTTLAAAQLTWDSVPTWVLFALALLVAWRVSRGGGGSAVTELSKANEVLTKRVFDLGAEVRDLRIENASLKARTDISLALTPLVEWSAMHETRAAERHAATLTVLDLIAARLGPDNGRAAAAV